MRTTNWSITPFTITTLILSCLVLQYDAVGDGINRKQCEWCATGIADEIYSKFDRNLKRNQCEQVNIYPKDYSPYLKDNEEFDFIVVGAGSAGSVIASRLSEISHFRILLIEAGPDPPYSTEIPNYAPVTYIPEIDWNYKTEYDGKSCLGYPDRRCPWPRGKVLGGSSTTNSLLYVRGAKNDYDGWAKVTKDDSWKFDNVLPYFKKSEDFQSTERAIDKNSLLYHGTDGDQTVGDFFTGNKYYEEKIEAIFAGCRETGVRTVEDESNPATFLGASKLHGTVRDGKRCSTAKGFLLPAGKRSNLKIAKRCLVTKVLLEKAQSNGNQLTAYGVELWNSEHGRQQVRARKEVIISGGTINSAQLLLLSGIGPRAHLEELRIPVLKDSPVGYNLHDHVNFLGFMVAFDMKSPRTELSFSDDVYRYLTRSDGVLSGVDLNSISIFTDLGHDAKESSNNLTSTVVHVTMTDYRYNDTEKANRILGDFREQITRSYISHVQQSDTIVFTPAVAKIRSRGRILLNSTDPTVAPRIVANYFGDARDRELMLRAIDWLTKLVNTQSMKKVGARILRLDIAECNDKKFASREYWECTLEHVVSTSFHPVGSVKMGSPDDSSAVLNSKLQVKGVSNLRVADASIMPEITSGNTNAPSIMIGEVAADFIKRDFLK